MKFSRTIIISISLFIFFLILPWIISKGDSNNKTILINYQDQIGKNNSKLYDSIFQNVFPIIASHPVPAGLKATKDLFQDIKACGFNTISYALSSNNIERAVGLAKETDLKMIIRTGNILTSSGKDIVDKYRNTKEIIGWYLKDEPTYEELDTLRKYYQIIKDLDPDKLVYINLIGDAIKRYIGNLNSYTEYLNYFYNDFHPVIWSYDCYPITESNGQIKVNFNLFYSNLESFSNIYRKTNTPFWAYCQCMEYSNNKLHWPKCTIPFLRFEAFSSLAYGAQGIIYFAYGLPESKTTSFLSAPINSDGKKTKEWYFVQQVNKEIAGYGKIFKGAQVIDCQHTGDIEIKNTKRYKKDFWPIAECISQKMGFLISLLKKNTEYYLIIVNHDVVYSQALKLSFQDGIKGGEVNLLNTGRLHQENFTNQLEKEITPGGYTVIKIKE